MPRGAVVETVDDAVVSGVLRASSSETGNFGLGAATRAQAMAAGEAWVGTGYSVSRNGLAWISQDGLRQFRAPNYKPMLDGWQANFERRFVPDGAWQGNGHLNIAEVP